MAHSHDVQIIAKSLSDNKTTTALDLGFGVGIEDWCVASLLDLLKTNTTLREIRLDGNNFVSDEMKQQIEAALQRNRDLAAAGGGGALTRGDRKQGAPSPRRCLSCFCG
jgi:hypothetical protein